MKLICGSLFDERPKVSFRCITFVYSVDYK